MPDRIAVSPTRGNLLRLREKLEQARSGHDLLDRKREALIQELFTRISRAESIERETRARVRSAREALWNARLRMGSDSLNGLRLAPTARFDVTVEDKNVMGVRLPVAKLTLRAPNPPYALGDSSAALDLARRLWLDVIGLLEKLTQEMTSVWRLSDELRKTQRRVNALESMIIPRYESSIDRIQQVLEEDERDDILHAREVQARREPRGGG